MSAKKMNAEKTESKKTELFDALEALERTKGIPVDYMRKIWYNGAVAIFAAAFLSIWRSFL